MVTLREKPPVSRQVRSYLLLLVNCVYVFWQKPVSPIASSWINRGDSKHCSSLAIQESLLFVSLPMHPHSYLSVNAILCISARTSFTMWHAWGRHVRTDQGTARRVSLLLPASLMAPLVCCREQMHSKLSSIRFSNGLYYVFSSTTPGFWKTSSTSRPSTFSVF